MYFRYCISSKTERVLELFTVLLSSLCCQAVLNTVGFVDSSLPSNAFIVQHLRTCSRAVAQIHTISSYCCNRVSKVRRNAKLTTAQTGLRLPFVVLS